MPEQRNLITNVPFLSELLDWRNVLPVLVVVGITLCMAYWELLGAVVILGIIGIALVAALIYQKPFILIVPFALVGRSSVERLEKYFTGSADLGLEWFYLAYLFLTFFLIFLVIKLSAGQLVEVHRQARRAGFLAFLFGLVLIFGFARNPSYYGLRKTVEYLFLTQSIFWLPILLLEDYQDYKFLILTLVAVCLVLGLFGIVRGVKEGFLGVKQLSALGGGPNPFARFMSVGIISAVALFFFPGNRRRWFYLPVGLFLGVCLIFAASRQAVIGLAISLFGFVFLLLYIKKGNFKTSILVSIVGVAMLAAASLAVVSMQDELSRRYPILMKFVYIVSDPRGGRAVSHRFLYHGLAYDMISDHPVVGSGTGAFAEEYLEDANIYYEDNNPHNIALEVLSENGLIGGVILALFLLAVVPSGLKLLRRGRYSAEIQYLALFGLTQFGFAFLVAQASGDLYENRLIWFFAGMIISLINIGINKELTTASNES